MSVIKQGLPKQYMENTKELLNLEDFSNIEDFEYFGDCSKALLENGLFSSPFDNLFNYFFFKFSNDKGDSCKDIKKLMRASNIPSDDLLLYITNLTALLVKPKKSRRGLLDNSEVVFNTVLNSYKLFLMYCFDIYYANKKFSSKGVACKYKDLDNIITLGTRYFKDFKKNLNIVLEMANPIEPHLKAMGVKQVFNLEESNLALFQKIRLKYDTILINSMIKNLLVNESPYYLSRQKLSESIVLSLHAELLMEEYNLELTEEFYTLLKKRAYLLPRNGISINPENMDISIDMYERQFNGDNFLVLVTNMEEVSFFTFINLTKEYIVNDSPCLYDLCNFLYCFYKLEGYAKDLYGEEFNSDPHLVVSFKTDSFISSGLVTIKGRSEIYDDFMVEVPYYWRYRDNIKYSPVSKGNFLKNRDSDSFIYVSAYKRKLPLGQKASDRAKELSKYYCIELEEDETLVSPFIRNS